MMSPVQASSNRTRSMTSGASSWAFGSCKMTRSVSPSASPSTRSTTMHCPLFNRAMTGNAFFRCARPSQSSLHLFGFEPDQSCAVDDLRRGDFIAAQHIVTNELRHRQMHAVMPGHDDETTEAGWLFRVRPAVASALVISVGACICLPYLQHYRSRAIVVVKAKQPMFRGRGEVAPVI